MREAEIAAQVVADGVARDAAVGWAVRTARGWEKGVGWASDAPGEPIFDLASVTKPMTALAIARSPLSKDAVLGEVVREARGTPAANATIEALLSHRAGLEAHVALWEEEEPLVTAARAHRGDDAPLYSDLGYILAGVALARTMGVRDAGEAIAELVVRPLGVELGTAGGLAGSDFAARVRPTEVLARRGGLVCGVVHDDNAHALTGAGGSGHAGMFGTVSAVLAFGCAADDAITRGAGPLACGDVSWLVAPRPGGSLRAGFDGKSAEGSSVGLRAGPRTYGHLGFTGTSLWIDPDAGALVALLTNRVHPTREHLAIREARPRVHDALFALAAEARA